MTYARVKKKKLLQPRSAVLNLFEAKGHTVQNIIIIIIIIIIINI